MKYNLKNRPVKASPQDYERWIKGFEKELREKLYAETIGYRKTELTEYLKEILGE